MSDQEIVFGTPEHIAGLSRKALEEDFRWVQDRRTELEVECERMASENAKLRKLVWDYRIYVDLAELAQPVGSVIVASHGNRTLTPGNLRERAQELGVFSKEEEQ